MSQQNIPEVHLEVCGGFFRIPTDKVIYNITVLEMQESSTAKVLGGIVEAEKDEHLAEQKEPTRTEPKVEAVAVDVVKENIQPLIDNYYQEAVTYYSGELDRLTGELLDFGQGEQQGGAVEPSQVQVLEKLGQTNKIVEDAKLILNDIQEQLSLPEAESIDDLAGKLGAGNVLAEGIKGVQANSGKLKSIIAKLQENSQASLPEPVEQAQPPKESIKKTIYLFDLDTVFQTIYELCTNETVKEHSQNVRAKAAELIDKDMFLDYVSERAKSYTEDDGFFSVPLTDVLSGLAAGCSDKKTINLLKNMDKNQGEIFLDQFLPLEVPPTEEIKVEEDDSGVEAVQVLAVDQIPDPLLGEAMELIDAVEASIVSLAASQEEGEVSAVPVGLGDESRTKVGEANKILVEIGTHISWVSEEIGKSSSALPESEGKSASVLQEIKDISEALSLCLVKKNDNPDLSFAPDATKEAPKLSKAEEPDVVAKRQSEEPEADDEDKQADIDDLIAGISSDNDLQEGNVADLEAPKLTEDTAADVGSEVQVGEPEADDEDKQADIDDLIAGISSENDLQEGNNDDLEENLELSVDDSPGVADSDDDFGEASQDDIDKLLAEMGG